MRLFIAVDVPVQVEKRLKDISAELSQYLIATAAKEFHITLKFLGEIEENMIDLIKEKLKDIDFEAFEINVSGLGVFDSFNHIKIIWAGLENGNHLIDINTKINNSLKGFNIKDYFRYHPHITLFRVKNVLEKDELKKKILSLKVEHKFYVDRFMLYKSTLTSDGPIYEPIAEFRAKI